MMADATRLDVLLTAAVIESITFLENCADREAVALEEFTAEAAMLRADLNAMQGARRTFLLQVLAKMYDEAAHRPDRRRAAHLAGLYHELAGTRPPPASPQPAAETSN
jgi:hypothetical protein